jgi:hypothetical protein
MCLFIGTRTDILGPEIQRTSHCLVISISAFKPGITPRRHHDRFITNPLHVTVHSYRC